MTDIETYYPVDFSAGDVGRRAQREEKWNAAEIESLRSENERLEAENGSLQAEIDRLMLEYCPEAMTPEQVARLALKGETG